MLRTHQTTCITDSPHKTILAAQFHLPQGGDPRGERRWGRREGPGDTALGPGSCFKALSRCVTFFLSSGRGCNRPSSGAKLALPTCWLLIF